MKKAEIKKLLERIANEKNTGEFADIYDWEVVEQKGNIYLIDKTEESYYSAWMRRDFEKALFAKGCYLECECPGRYVVIE